MRGKAEQFALGNRQDRLLRERTPEPCKVRDKPGKTTVCQDCKAVFLHGRWQWLPSPPRHVNKQLCPACRRCRDRVPAGYLTLRGDFLHRHYAEIISLVHHIVDRQKAEYPLKRLMGIEDRGEGDVMVTFTDLHLPREVAEAIVQAYKGDLNVLSTREGDGLRVYWQR